MAFLKSYTYSNSTHPYSLMKDEDKESNDRKSKTLSHKGNIDSSTGDYGDEDDDDCCCCCITCCRTSKKTYSVETSAVQGSVASMQGSTLTRKNSIGKAGPEYFSHPAIKGIKNLGNTCYLNAVLQCLNQTVEFHKLLSDGAHPHKHDQAYFVPSLYNSDKLLVEVTNPKLGYCGKELYYFIFNINSSESLRFVKPNKLLSRIRQKNKRFQGSHPQDSHEMFRFILECIRSEEAEVVKNGIRKVYEHCDEEDKKLKEGYLTKAEKCCKLLNKVFVGSVVNTIICRECNNVLLLHEEVYDLSIPVAKRTENTSDCYNNSFEHSTTSNYLTATEGTNAQYEVVEEDQVNIHPKSPTYSIASSLQSGSRRGSRHGSLISNQCNFELSVQRHSPGGSKFSTLPMLTKRYPPSRSHDVSIDVSIETNASSYSDSVHTGIIRIPRVPPTPETATSNRTFTQSQSVDKTNSSMSKAVVEHHSNMSSPISPMGHNDSTDLKITQVPLATTSIRTPVSSNISRTSNKSSEIDSECTGGFATNEQQLQLHLKGKGNPYRIMRCNVETDLEAGLQTYFELDVLDENNKFICDNCTAKRMKERGYPEDATTSIGLSKVSKQLSIAWLPEILVLQVKRFSLGYRVTKCTDAITFPLILDMAQYCTNECLQEFADRKKRVLYGLYGVIEHRGHGLHGGHYVAYLRRRNKLIEEGFVNPTHSCYNEEEAKKGEWFLANDQQVTKVAGGFETVKGRQAYILFYERLSVNV